MRDCIFYVADQNMAETFTGFLNRPNFHLSMGCGAFQFDPLLDIARAKGKTDGGLWRHAGSLCKGYLKTHHKLVVALDRDFGGSPGQTQIRKEIAQQLLSAGWQQSQFIVLVIDPELEQWIWQDNIHVESALKYTRPPSLRAFLAQTGDWPAGQDKPTDPKAAFEKCVVRQLRGNRSSSLYRKIAANVSVTNCRDAEFQSLRQQLQVWFP